MKNQEQSGVFRTAHPYWVWESIQSIPSILSSCWENQTSTDINEIVNAFAMRKINKVILLGRGSSFYAAVAVKPFIEKLTGLPVSCQVTNEFLCYPYEICDENTAVFFISHSGKSEGDLMVLDFVKQKKAYAVGVTDISDSDLAKAVDQLLLGPGGKKVEHPATRTYSAAKYRMMLLALELAKLNQNWSEVDYYQEALRKLPNQISNLLLAYGKQVPDVVEVLKDSKNLVVIGFGPNIANAEEAAMAFNQSTGIPTQGYEMENYIHGPIQAVTKETGVICIAPSGLLQERMVALMSAVHHIGAKSVLLAPEDITLVVTDQKITFPAGIPDLISPMITMVPLWVTAYFLGLKLCKGAHPDRLSMDKPEFKEGLSYIMKTDKWINKK